MVILIHPRSESNTLILIKVKMAPIGMHSKTIKDLYCCLNKSVDNAEKALCKQVGIEMHDH